MARESIEFEVVDTRIGYFLLPPSHPDNEVLNAKRNSFIYDQRVADWVINQARHKLGYVIDAGGDLGQMSIYLAQSLRLSNNPIIVIEG